MEKIDGHLDAKNMIFNKVVKKNTKKKFDATLRPKYQMKNFALLGGEALWYCTFVWKIWSI